MKYLSTLALCFCFSSFSLWLVSVCDAQASDDLWKQQKNDSGVQSNSAALHAAAQTNPHLRLTDENLQFLYKGNSTRPENEVSSTAAVKVAEESANESILTERFYKVTMTSATQAKTAMMHPAPSTTSVHFNVTEFSSTGEVNKWRRNHSGLPVVTSSMLETTTRPLRNTTFFGTLRTTVKKVMSQAGSGFLRKLFHADVSSECAIGIIKFTQAIQELQPWALRLMDATAKYPNGIFQMTLADLGAYDECIETVERDADGIVQVRGQYCDVQLKLTDNNTAVDELLQAVTLTNAKAAKFKSLITKPSMPGFRLGLCFIDACKERDLTNMGRAFAGTGVKVNVKNCVTNEPKEMNRAQICILASLAVLATIIVAATCLDLYAETQDKKLMQVLSHNYFLAFSVLRSSRLLRNAQRNHHFDTRCFHGLRFLSMYWVCLTHMYIFINENISRLINTVQFSQHWTSPILIAGFLSVDTFFFLSGFLLYHSLNNEKRNQIIGVLIMLIRRLIRTTIPVFFMIMCIYLLPLMVSGPNSKEFYNRFYTEVHNQWWSLLLQIRNWRTEDYQTAPMIQLWYLSADYQLFVVAVLVIQAFGTKKRFVAFIFTALSLITCGVSAWQMYGTNMLPFVIPWHSSYSASHDTIRFYYYLPFYHAVCFFSGCITFSLVKKYGKAEISKVMQALFWCIALSCGLCCLFMKLEWHRSEERATETKRMIVSFSDRLLWSICICWFTFACISGRGGFINKFLSWNGFVPLSQLSFGVYLIHLPFLQLMHRIARERRHYSHFNVVSDCFVVLIWSYMLSYVLFIACEAPSRRLANMAFNLQGKSTAMIHATDNDKKSTSDYMRSKHCRYIEIGDKTTKVYPTKSNSAKEKEDGSSRL